MTPIELGQRIMELRKEHDHLAIDRNNGTNARKVAIRTGMTKAMKARKKVPLICDMIKLEEDIKATIKADREIRRIVRDYENRVDAIEDELAAIFRSNTRIVLRG